MSLLNKINKSLVLLFILFFLQSQIITAEENDYKFTLSFNLLNLISNDISQYPIGLEIKTATNIFNKFIFENIFCINYGIQLGYPDYFFYYEPRIRSINLKNKYNPFTGIYFSGGVFIGLGTSNKVIETIQGLDANVGYFYNITEKYFIDTSIGIQYPDYPLARTFRIHYFVPSINFISLRTNISLGIKL